MSGRGRGRGAYYRAKYGGRGVPQQHGVSLDTPNGVKTSTNVDRTWYTLETDLKNLDGQQYGAYKSLRGLYTHTLPDFNLSVDHVQGDAFAAPSRVSVRMSWEATGFPSSYADSDIRAIALADYLSRTAADFIRSRHMNASVESSDSGWHGPKGGVFNINSPGQQILPRTSAMVVDRLKHTSIELRFTVSLPARGRNILGHEAFKILGVNLPDLVKAVLLYSRQDKERLKAHIESTEDQHFMRSQLAERGLIGFVANGAILPRASGASSRPLTNKSVVPFQSPPSLEVALGRLHGPDVRGMGIASGVTLLTGGGYHGKSTLLQALQLGIYNHVPGDGRELVVTDPTAVKVRAEDGRAVTGTDISPFIKDLPGGRNTTMFTTDDASGSTSMAAGIQEALEVGCRTLMIDEDTSATNLLVRDERMQALVRNEPITPLVSKVRALYSEHDVSTIIVIGGLGDWLSVADRVVGMESYIPEDLTQLAKDLVQRLPRDIGQDLSYGSLPGRGLQYPESVTRGRTPWAKTKNFIILPSTEGVKDPSEADNGVDVSGVEQLVESGQTKLIAHTLTSLAKSKRRDDLATEMASFEHDINITSCLSSSLVGGDFVAVRSFEMSAAVCRLRGTRAISSALPTLKKQRIHNI